MSPLSSKLRILCLHGWMQNAQVMKRNMGPIIQRFEGSIEFVFLTGPFELPTPQRQDRPDNTPLAAWMLPKVDDNGIMVDVEGFEESVSFIIEFIQKNGPFDGVLGFSQGAALSVLLMYALTHQDLREQYSIPTDIPQFRLAIVLAGFRFLTSNFTNLYTTGKINTPTMHVYSKEDTIITADRTLELIETTFTDSVQSVHNLGHRIVGTPSLIKDYERFFHRFVYIQPTTSL